MTKRCSFCEMHHPFYFWFNGEIVYSGEVKSLVPKPNSLTTQTLPLLVRAFVLSKHKLLSKLPEDIWKQIITCDSVSHSSLKHQTTTIRSLIRSCKEFAWIPFDAFAIKEWVVNGHHRFDEQLPFPLAGLACCILEDHLEKPKKKRRQKERITYPHPQVPNIKRTFYPRA